MKRLAVLLTISVLLAACGRAAPFPTSGFRASPDISATMTAVAASVYATATAGAAPAYPPTHTHTPTPRPAAARDRRLRPGRITTGVRGQRASWSRRKRRRPLWSRAPRIAGRGALQRRAVRPRPALARGGRSALGEPDRAGAGGAAVAGRGTE
jgi:hypothetical protein